MNLRELYETSIRLGKAIDPRGEAGLQRQMEATRGEYEALPEWGKPFFDRERFNNPYGDVRIANGPDDVELKTIMMGINIGVPELLLADRLRERGTRIDAVIAHHTTGIGVAPSLLRDFMPVAIDQMAAAGVPRAHAARVINANIEQRALNLEDNARIGPDTARLLGFPLACIHTPADYHQDVGLRALMEQVRPPTLRELLAALFTVPEVQASARASGAVPRLMTGTPDRAVGRIYYRSGGGYALPAEAFTLLGEAGVDTVIQLNCLPAQAKAAQEANVAIVRVPHAAMDNIGINLLFDKIEAEYGPLEVVPCNSFERIRRRQPATAPA